MKKNIFSMGLMAAAALTLTTNCAKTEADFNQAEGTPFELIATSAETKVANDGMATKWSANDQINVFYAEAGSTTYTSAGKFTTATGGSSVTFTGTISGTLNDNNDWYAFFPYKSSLTTPANTSTYYFNVGGDQTQGASATSTAHLAGDKFPLYGNAKNVANGTTPTIEMKHAMSVVKVHVTNNSGAPLTVSSVTFSTEDYNIGGQFYIDFTGDSPVFTAKSGNVYKTATLTVTGGKTFANGESADFYIGVAPFTAVTGKKLSVKVNDFSKEITLAASTTFESGKVKTLNFNYNADPVIYSTSFTYPVVGSDYANADPHEASDVAGTKWYITYGNWYSGNCAQFRVYSAGNFGSLYNGFDCSGVKTVYYDAKSSNDGLKLNTYYSTDSGANWTIVDNGLTLTDTYARYSFVVSDTGAYPKVRIKFEATGAKPSSSNYHLSIDNVSICGIGSILASPSITADNITGVPASGVSAADATYNIHNFTGADDIVATCDGAVVTDVIAGNDGTILFDVAANLSSSSRSTGSITLSSPREGVEKVISVTQLGESFSSSTSSVVISKDATSGSFTITTPSFGWKAIVNAAGGKNLSIVGATSGAGSDSAQTITVSSSDLASEEEQTLGTIVIYRNDNVDDPQKKTVTIKKAAASAGPLFTATFEGNSEHRTSGSNNYSSNEYTVGDVLFSLTYSDAVSSDKLDGSYNITMRTAKKTNNCPSLTTGNILSSTKSITKVSYLYRNGASSYHTSQTLEYSTDGGKTWNAVSPSADTKVHATYGYSYSFSSPISTDSFSIRFTVNCIGHESTNSTADSYFDNLTVYGE